MATIDEIIAAIRDLVINITSSITDLISRLKKAISSIIDSIIETIRNIVGNIFDQIAGFIDRVFVSIESMFDRVVAAIQNITSSIVGYIKGLVDNVVSFIQGMIADATAILENIFNSIVAGIESLVSSALLFFQDIVSAVKLRIQEIVNSVKLFFGDLFDIVAAGVNSVILSAGQVVGSIKAAIIEFVQQVVDVVGNSLRDLLETISNLPDVINSMAESLIESAKENIASPIAGIPVAMIKAISEAVGGAPVKESDAMQLDALNMVFGQSPVERSPEKMRGFINDFMPENPIIKTIVIIILTPLILMQTLGGMASANSQILLQEHALVNPYRLLEPADAITAWRYDLMDKKDTRDMLRKTGYPEQDANIIMEIAEFVPPPGELVNWWLRGLIEEDELKKGLRKQGWNDNDSTKLKTAAFFIPPVQDLISMAVREAFSPDIAEQFGQFEDFPDALTEHANKQGVSDEWSRRYWAAHWALPSVQMGFEMLHREVITSEQFDLLLRASDVMPFWRDKLISISFNPLTRVDVRRMHKVGVITLDEVNRAYRDIGYDELNAQRLTDFTEQINKSSDEDSEGALSDLTRSNIMRFFRDGILTRQETLETLLATGISSEATELFIISAELDIEAEERRDSINLVLERAKGGVINFDKAQSDLDALGLATLEKQKAINTLLRDKAKRNKIPSKGDLDKLFKQGIIDAPEYLDYIERLGFSTEWAQRFLRLNGVQ